MALNGAVRNSLSLLLINKPVLVTATRGFKKNHYRVRQEMKNRKDNEKPRVIPRSQFSNWNYSSEVYAFGKRLQENFQIELLFQAFVNRSYVIKEEIRLREVGIANPNIQAKNNEEFAKAGEKLMSNYIKKYLSYSLPKVPDEGIDAIRDHLLRRDILADIAKNLGVTDLVLTSEYPVENESLVRTFKAIITALAESSGIERANLLVRDFVLTQLSGADLFQLINIKDPLKVVSKILENEGRQPPEPRILHQTAMGTIFANYHVGIYSNKELLGHSSGESINVAIEMAAEDVLRRFFDLTDSSKPLRFNLEQLDDVPSNIKLSDWSSENVGEKSKIASISSN